MKWWHTTVHQIREWRELETWEAIGSLLVLPATGDNCHNGACATYSACPMSSAVTAESGTLYISGCYAEGNKDCQISEKSWDSRTDTLPSLSVFEHMELEFPPKVASREDSFDFSCPVILP